MSNVGSIKKYINKFKKGLKRPDNYSQFDYCYNYFHFFYKKNSIKEIKNRQNLQMSCLQLGFYLASFGMLRGSTVLSKKSIGYLKKLIILISNSKRNLWKIDVDSYNKDNIRDLLELYKKIKKALSKSADQRKPTVTLITKIMLGVFGNVPAFDINFKKGLGVAIFNENSLSEIKKFYTKHENEICNLKIPTFNFFTGKRTQIYYTKARLIDICGFQKGLNKLKRRRKNKRPNKKSA